MKKTLFAALVSAAFMVGSTASALPEGGQDCGWQCMINCASAFPDNDLYYYECVADCRQCGDDGDYFP